MDEEQKTHENTSTAFLSLKAELLRKQKDLQKSSFSSNVESSSILENLQSSSSSLKLKTQLELDLEVVSCSKKKKVESSTDRQNPEKNESISREEENLLEKSRSILEAKAKLYEEILSTGERAALADDDDEQDDRAFLVDFQKKIYENNEKTSKIEFIDDDGRIRFFEPEKYQSLTEEQRKASEQRLASRNTAQQIEQVERAHREQMRSKWEADIEQLRNKNQIHYQDLLFDEVRQHGVSYFQFSTDEKLRAEQMTTLNEIREKTQVEQRKSAQEKDFRQVTINERLKKIRERKAKEMGIQLDRDGTPIPSKKPKPNRINRQKLNPIKFQFHKKFRPPSNPKRPRFHKKHGKLKLNQKSKMNRRRNLRLQFKWLNPSNKKRSRIKFVGKQISKFISSLLSQKKISSMNLSRNFFVLLPDRNLRF